MKGWMQLARQPHVWLLALLFLSAAAIRVSHLDESRFMAERQYRSALIARADYLAGAESGPGWRKAVAAVSAGRMGVLEPPLMESLAVQAYRLLGKETLRIPRLIAALFWLAGGALLYRLARHFVSPNAALYATAYYLFLPLGVAVSIAFIPDALMIMLFIAGVLAIVRYAERPSRGRLLLAGALCGACVLVKPLAIFTLAGAFIALRTETSGLRGLLTLPAVAMGAFLLLPALSYYVYAMYIQGSMSGQAEASFIPALLLQPTFWTRWATTATNAMGALALALALPGLLIPADRRFRFLIVGLIAGYSLFCLVFAFHVRIASHYHLQLVIPVALGAGAAVDFFVTRLQAAAGPRRLVRSSLLAAAGIVSLVAVTDASREIRSQRPIVSPAVASKVGETVGHSTRVVYVSQYYGAPLEYHGELSGWFWPRSMKDTDRALGNAPAAAGRSVAERLGSLGTAQARAAPDFVPEYFVITDFREYAHHADLAGYLDTHCRKIAEAPDYLVYGECAGPPG